MNSINITYAEVERVRKIAVRKKDEWEGDETAEESARILIEFCDVLLGKDTVDSFLRSQDMDS